MSEHADLIGQVVTSKAGRDKGRSFLVTVVFDQQHVYLVDGTLRKLAKPKKKKLKHLSMEPSTAEGIREKLCAGKQVFDAEIRNCLMNMGYNLDEEE